MKLPHYSILRVNKAIFKVLLFPYLTIFGLHDLRLRFNCLDFFTAFLHRQVTAPDLNTNQSTNQSINQRSNRSINQSVSQSINQMNGLIFNRPDNLYQSINKSINQFIIGQLISINRSMNLISASYRLINNIKY